MHDFLASRQSVSELGHVTHGAMALQPNGFCFRLIPQKSAWPQPIHMGSEEEGQQFKRGGSLTFDRGTSPPRSTSPPLLSQLSRQYVYILPKYPNQKRTHGMGLPDLGQSSVGPNQPPPPRFFQRLFLGLRHYFPAFRPLQPLPAPPTAPPIAVRRLPKLAFVPNAKRIGSAKENRGPTYLLPS